MNNYENKSVVSKTEAEALKDMIFSRVKERSKALADDVNQSYMSSVQNDVMDIARNSFVANRNPFSLDTANKREEVYEESSAKEKNLKESKKQVEQLKAQIYNKNNEYKKEIIDDFINRSMAEARPCSETRMSFVGALNFLNAQASIALVNSKGKQFDATA